MTAREYFEAVARAVREHRDAEVLLQFGPARSGTAGGGGDPRSGGPVAARFASDELAREVMASTEAVVGEALALLEGLIDLFGPKALAVELHYLDGLRWADVAAELDVGESTARLWCAQVFDFVDSAGWARAREGVGMAQ